jgi:hypothetical protein
MITLTKTNTADIIYCTPQENTYLVLTIYKIIFTNRTTTEIVNYWGTDASTTKRYQMLTINTSSLFANYDEGFWDYQIYGCASVGGTPNTPLLEIGYMKLNKQTAFAPTKYSNQSNLFTTYNGQP